MKPHLCCSVIPLVFGLFIFIHHGQGASNVSVTPASISADYIGNLTVTANVGLANRVFLSVIVDFNGNGSIDGADGPLAVYDFYDTDIVTLPHPGLVYDNDEEENGQIQAVIPAFDAPHIAGDFIIRVQDSGSPATATFSVTPPVGWNQSVTGSVAKGLANRPAVVMGVMFFGDSEIEIGTTTDHTGDFELFLPMEGLYAVAAFYPNLLTDLESGSAWLLNVLAGQTHALPFDLQLFDGDYTVSGRVQYADSPSTGIPYLQLFLETDSDAGGEFMSLTTTDQDGNFTLPAKAGTFEIRPESQNQRGLVIEATQATIVDRNLIGVALRAWNHQGLISGTVTNLDPGVPLHQGLEIYAGNLANEWIEITDVYTDPDGNYSIGVTPGSWGLGPDGNYLAIFDYAVLPPQWRNVDVSSMQYVQDVDFTIGAADTFLNVHTREGTPTGPPVGNVAILIQVSPSGDFAAYRETDEFGDVRLPLQPGAYTVNVDNDTIRDRGYAQPEEQEITLADGAEENLTFALQVATATATVRVWDVLNNPVPDTRIGIYRWKDTDYVHAGGGFTDLQGQIVVPIMPGSYATSIQTYMGSLDGFVWHIEEFTASEGQSVLIDLYLFLEQATLNIYAQDNTGNPFPVQFIITDENRQVEIARVWTDFAGNASLEVPAIPLRISVDPTTLLPGFELPDPQFRTPVIAGTENVTFIFQPAVDRLEADLNGDHVVDYLDLLIFMSQWGQTW